MDVQGTEAADRGLAPDPKGIRERQGIPPVSKLQFEPNFQKPGRPRPFAIPKRQSPGCCWKLAVEQPGNSPSRDKGANNRLCDLHNADTVQPGERNLNRHTAVIMPYRDIGIDTLPSKKIES